MLVPVLLAALARGADEAVLVRVAQGDAGALRTVYERLGPAALALALRILRARPEAEEVVQEAFVEVWRRAASFDGARGSAATWVLSICRNRALDRLRSRGAAGRTAQVAQSEVPEPVPLPIETAEARQERDRVQRALAALPAEQRLAVELAYFEGLTQREIAERTGDPLGTVKTRVRLALEKLAGLLAEVST